MMSLNISKKNLILLKTILMKNIYMKKAFWLQSQDSASMHKLQMTIGPVITV